MNVRPGLRLFPLTAALCAAAAVAGCSSPDSAAGFTAGKDQPLVISLDDLVAKAGTGAVLGVSLEPEHGNVTRRADGAYVYTPSTGYTGLDQFTVNTTDAVRLYTTDIPVLGEFGGATVQGSGFGSAWTTVPGSHDEFYGLTDRGPNVDGPGKNEKLSPTPSFVPKIGRFKLVDNKAVLQSSIELRSKSGAPFNGQVDISASTGETIKDLQGNVLPPTDHGLDPEGLVALADGTFWVSDEYGPFLVHFDAKGTEIERLAPGNGLPKEIALRTPNQGMEGLTITPDGSTLVGVVQSALNTPGLSGSAKEVPFARIVTVDLKTKAQREFLYPLENPKQSKVAVSEITALSATTFLVDERDGNLAPKSDKKIWTIDIAGATDVGPQAAVPGATYDAEKGGLLIDGKPLETLIGVTPTADAVAALTKIGVTPVAKKSNLDLSALVAALDEKGRFFGHDKIEGITTLDGGKTIYIANDSDFGLAASQGEQPPFGLKPKTLPNGVQDTGEVLAVDTTKLPAKIDGYTVKITVK
ncbi:esterase-like activity of phytase family protein [Nocardia alba]|uniref:Phytase-like protein with esterase activity n=1 Tax=Nocardia alba TaxID=225051 RepID=A0A4R1G9Z2_9NOCA|nr:esterase-like activity of phytase family protein [Nocardia alba]TCK00992.1 phytase-like protein with esterase activity [Nocardia alba]